MDRSCRRSPVGGWPGRETTPRRDALSTAEGDPILRLAVLRLHPGERNGPRQGRDDGRLLAADAQEHSRWFRARRIVERRDREDLDAALEQVYKWGVSELPQGHNWIKLPEGMEIELMQAPKDV